MKLLFMIIWTRISELVFKISNKYENNEFKLNKILLIKPYFYLDLYTKNSNEINNVLLSSYYRLGPVGLITDLNSDFYITQSEKNNEQKNKINKRLITKENIILHNEQKKNSINVNNINFKNFSANLLRMQFSEALSLFDDSYFDFIYVDGFAHTGEEGGKTLIDWFKKLKVGGILAGDDYHEDWPLVIWAVNDLCKQLNCNLNLTKIFKEDEYSSYPSWYIIKNREINNLKVNELLYITALKEKKRIGNNRVSFKSFFKRIIGQLLTKLRLKDKIKNILKI